MPSEYSVDFNRGFQPFSMANLQKGSGRHLVSSKRLNIHDRRSVTLANKKPQPTVLQMRKIIQFS